MTAWNPQHYKRRGQELNVDENVLAHAIEVSKAITSVDPALPPIFSLGHLAFLTGVEYGLLRAIASRSLIDPYKTFRIHKRSSDAGERRYRVICVPESGLLQAQHWIAHEILARGNPHVASVAYARGNTILAGAEQHCECTWLIKLDVRNFFESISEISAYRVFRSFEYQPLVAFELARICTRLGSATALWTRPRWRSRQQHEKIKMYKSGRMGYLPQGAPTSPMLSNLAMRGFDALVEKIARRENLVYTRYADDLTLSVHEDGFNRDRASRIIGEIYAAMGSVGLSPNIAKTRVSPPGSRKIVLGLLVDGPRPRLTREFKLNIRQHLHFLLRSDVGPTKHAKAREFDSIAGVRHHLQGLVAFACQIEPEYGRVCKEKLQSVTWPV